MSERFYSMLWRRFRGLIEKLVGVKGLIFILATVFLTKQIIDPTTWFLCAGAVAGIRAAEKEIERRRGQ